MADCTSVVLLLGDPFTVCGELTRTLASLKNIGSRFEVLLVCDGPAWKREPAVQSFLVHGPRPGLLQTRSCVDHPAPLIHLALDWLRTPYLHLLWPGVAFRAENTARLCDALDHIPEVAVAVGMGGVTAHGAVLRASAVQANGLCLEQSSQSTLDQEIGNLGEVLMLPSVECDEPRWSWTDYPFLKRWPTRVAGNRVRVAA